MRRLDKDISYLDNNHTKEQGKNKARQTLITKSNRETICIVIFLEFHSTKQGLPLVDSWSRGLD